MQKTKPKSKDIKNDEVDKNDEETTIPRWNSIRKRYRRLMRDQIAREKAILKRSSILSVILGIIYIPIILFNTVSLLGAVASFILSLIWTFNAIVGYFNHKEDEKFLSLHIVGLLGIFSFMITTVGIFEILGFSAIPYSFYLTVQVIPMSYMLGYTYSQIRNVDYS